ncbi:hypothetical protein [Komagataeibacter diospyri]|uniref:hypothetical protein n=1 Tax=Komagataeibacter diospyri TaxID=1932662 RepID=UPI001D040C56|nr:hypothetical protein [Komagataeibacter diospyri]
MGCLIPENLEIICGYFKQEIVQASVMVIEVRWRYLDFPRKATHRQIFQPFGFQYPDGGNPEIFGDVSFMVGS